METNHINENCKYINKFRYSSIIKNKVYVSYTYTLCTQFIVEPTAFLAAEIWTISKVLKNVQFSVLFCLIFSTNWIYICYISTDYHVFMEYSSSRLSWLPISIMFQSIMVKYSSLEILTDKNFYTNLVFFREVLLFILYI